MFAFTGMTGKMCDELPLTLALPLPLTLTLTLPRCDQLTAEHDIYLTRDGRISLAGTNAANEP